jgi:cytochrome bd-type quinol oxidase subunit 1
MRDRCKWTMRSRSIIISAFLGDAIALLLGWNTNKGKQPWVPYGIFDRVSGRFTESRDNFWR